MRPALLSQAGHIVDRGLLRAGATVTSPPALAAPLAFPDHSLSDLLPGAEK